MPGVVRDVVLVSTKMFNSDAVVLDRFLQQRSAILTLGSVIVYEVT